MEADEFRTQGRIMVDYICDYMTNLSSRRVFPGVRPGYLAPQLPTEAPEDGEDWTAIMKDVEDYIMPAVTHWQHPRFHAYFPAGNAYPSILGDMLSSGLGVMANTWSCSPVATELEIKVADWVAGMFGLPDHFKNDSGIGGGCLQGSASDSILLSMLAARNLMIEKMKSARPDLEPGQVLTRLIGYCSCLAHCSVEKAGMLSLVRIRQLEVDENNFALRGRTLREAIQEDRKRGLIPLFAACTLGSTACCSFDDLEEMGEVCKAEGIKLHVDSAYGGNAFICPEFRHRLKGIENAFSMNFNPNKWMLINFDCSVLWTADKRALLSALAVNKQDLDGEKIDQYSLNLENWGIPDERRFRALKMWTTIRNYGVDGLQFYIREHTRLALLFDSFVRTDNRFEVIGETCAGLACFRLRGSNAINELLMHNINDSGKIHMVPASVGPLYIIRFALCAENACEEDVRIAWKVVRDCAKPLLAVKSCADRWRQLTRAKSKMTDPVDHEETCLKECQTFVEVNESYGNNQRRLRRLEGRPVARIVVE